MSGFFKKLFGTKSPEPRAEESVTYKGFLIQPVSQNQGNGWSTQAVISRTQEGVTQSHEFIRADTTGDRDGAVKLTVSKCMVFIDQAGDDIFQN